MNKVHVKTGDTVVVGNTLRHNVPLAVLERRGAAGYMGVVLQLAGGEAYLVGLANP